MMIFSHVFVSVILRFIYCSC